MATAGDLQTLDQSEAGAVATRLPRVELGLAAGRSAGPFDIDSASAKTTTARDTLVTALLVIYPAFATVAAIVVGLALTRGV